MASPADRGKEKEALSPRTTREKLAEALGKMEIIDEEATPLVLDDLEEGSKEKWMLTGKFLHRHTLHIQTISNALRPAWGNPKGLSFKPVEENMFVAEFACQRDRDHVWEGSPWHVGKNVVILSEFDECMRPSELKFDKLQLWARVLNLPFNLRAKPWSTAIAHQIDKKQQMSSFIMHPLPKGESHHGGRQALEEVDTRQCMDPYDILYENEPHFCFSCRNLGHSDLLWTMPGTRDDNGDLPFGKGLRAQDERKKTMSGDSSTRESFAASKSKADTRNSSTTAKSMTKVTSPVKQPRNQQKIKGGPQAQNQMNRRVDRPLLAIHPHKAEDGSAKENPSLTDSPEGSQTKREPKKKKPTLNNSDSSAAAVSQPCPKQLVA